MRKYKRIESRRREFLNFLSDEAKKGRKMIQHKELVSWALKEKMSKHTLQEVIKFWLKIGFILREKRENFVFYGLTSKFRQSFSVDYKRFEILVSKIQDMSEEEKRWEIKNLIGYTMNVCIDFVPFMIHHFLRNKDTLGNLQDDLTGSFEHAILPYLFETIKACVRNEKIVAEILPLEKMDQDFLEFLDSDYLKERSS